MKKVRYMLSVILICIFIYGTTVMIYANNHINFKHITIEDGLSQSTVQTLYQDSKGYIWIGTNDGLDRYNGYEIKKYKKNKEEKNSLVSNYIIDITEDLDGNLWIGTTAGLSKINLNSDNIANYTSEYHEGNLSDDNICEILVTDNNDILVATNDGLNLYDKDNDLFKRILNKDDMIASQSIYSLDQDENGDLWIGTDKGLSKIDVKNNTIKKISTKSNQDDDEFIYKVYCDKDDNVWVGTVNEGLIKIKIKDNKISRYKNNADDDKSIAGDFVRNIIKTDKEELWICTSTGLSKYDDKKDNFESYTNIPHDKYSILDNNIFSIIEDSNGLIFIGTYKGISFFDPNNKIEQYKNDPFDENSISDNLIHGIYEDNKELVWIGTNSKGVNILNRKDNHVERISEEDGLSSNFINSITGSKGTIWIGTSNGLNKIDINKKTIRVYKEAEGLLNSKIKSLYLDKQQYLWIGTSDGLFILDTKSDKIIDITNSLRKNNVDDTYIETIYEDCEGNFWIGTFVKGYLVKIDTKNKRVYTYNNQLESNTIRSITEDSNENIWVGTSDGLFRFDKSKEEFTEYTVADGLSNNTIYGILIDDYGNPWVSTNNGISKFDSKNKKFTNFYQEDGLQSDEFNGAAYYKNSKGEFIFGGINGLNIFHPNDIKSYEKSEKVVFDEFIIKGDVYKNIDNIVINYYDNMIGIKFFLPNYKNKSNVQYQYKIEGKDEQWHTTNNNQVIYNNLSPGKYEFKVKARNHNGVTSKENSISFTIKPPFWMSIEAYIIYMIIIVYIIYLNRSKVKRLDRLVEKRTKELSNEIVKNKELFNRVIKLEKNKNNYFINLSHELRTPLNVISTTEQLITTLNKKGDGISREKLDYHMSVMKKNTKRLLNLINNIIDTNKVEHGNYSLNIKEYDIVYIVEEIALSMKDHIENKGIELIIDPEIEEKIIQCDKAEIERCIVNLLSNASKFTKPGGKIEVSIKDLDSSVEIIVKDTGIGIDFKHHNYIFDRFNQIIDEESETKGGSGLGLTITKHIIDLHGGSISVESQVNKGSSFKIILNTKYVDNIR